MMSGNTLTKAEKEKLAELFTDITIMLCRGTHSKALSRRPNSIKVSLVIQCALKAAALVATGEARMNKRPPRITNFRRLSDRWFRWAAEEEWTPEMIWEVQAEPEEK